MTIVITKSGAASNQFLDRVSLVQGDITQQKVDAIAMVMPQSMDFKGGINRSIGAACGYDLDAFILDHVYKPKVGEVYALPGGDLPVRHILLGVIPKIKSEFDRNESYLSGVTRSIMELGRCMLLSSIAFPPIAAGKKLYPKPKAARLICKGITDRLQDNFEEVRLVCPDAKTKEIFEQKLNVIGWEGR